MHGKIYVGIQQQYLKSYFSMLFSPDITVWAFYPRETAVWSLPHIPWVMTALCNSEHFSRDVYCSTGHHGTSVKFIDGMYSWNLRKVRKDYSVEEWKPKSPSPNTLGSLVISLRPDRGNSFVKNLKETHLLSGILILRSLWKIHDYSFKHSIHLNVCTI